MDYIPRYAQPFTLQEARQLAVPIITEGPLYVLEISRLQNSLAHLQTTQDELKEALSTSPGDADLTQAFEENEIVIGSQTERISMLQMVLAEKGVPTSTHYGAADGQPTGQAAPGGAGSRTPEDPSQPTAAQYMDGSPAASREDIEGGIYL